MIPIIIIATYQHFCAPQASPIPSRPEQFLVYEKVDTQPDGTNLRPRVATQAERARSIRVMIERNQANRCLK